eukprot:226888-Prymnesium_polylepis.1
MSACDDAVQCDHFGHPSSHSINPPLSSLSPLCEQHTHLHPMAACSADPSTCKLSAGRGCLQDRQGTRLKSPNNSPSPWL